MKLSAVIISRNDNYGGNLKERATYCLNSMVTSFDEVIYVDWNSPGIDLIEEIKPNLLKTGRLKYVVVTPQKAQEFTRNTPNVQTCCEVLGRNIGIRRATGDVIVSTNIDIVAPRKDLIIFPGFDDKTFYSYARRDIDLAKLTAIGNDIPPIQEKLLETINDYTPHGHSGACAGDKWSMIDCCGDFQVASANIWHTIRGFEEKFIFRGFADTNNQRKAANYGFNIAPKFDIPVFHIRHGSGFGGGGGLNNLGEAVMNFDKTSNPDTWGFSNVSLDIKEI